jgi:hypothetical protein
MNEAGVYARPAHSHLVVTTSQVMTRRNRKVITGSEFSIPGCPDFQPGFPAWRKTERDCNQIPAKMRLNMCQTVVPHGVAA